MCTGIRRIPEISCKPGIYFPVVDGFDDPKSHAELVRFTPFVHFNLAETPVGKNTSHVLISSVYFSNAVVQACWLLTNFCPVSSDDHTLTRTKYVHS